MKMYKEKKELQREGEGALEAEQGDLTQPGVGQASPPSPGVPGRFNQSHCPHRQGRIEKLTSPPI